MQGEKKVTVPTGEVDPKNLVSSILGHINPRLGTVKYRPCKQAGLNAALLKYEENTVNICYPLLPPPFSSQHPAPSLTMTPSATIYL